jgi:hypothetical protein
MAYGNVEKLRQKAAGFSLIPIGPIEFFFLFKPKNNETSKMTVYRQFSERVEKIQVAHPANTVLDSFCKQNSKHGSEGQDAIEDYSESGAKVQVLFYGKAQWSESSGTAEIIIEMVARAHSQPICSGCGRKRPWYDKLSPRQLGLMPLGHSGVFHLRPAPRPVQELRNRASYEPGTLSVGCSGFLDHG